MIKKYTVLLWVACLGILSAQAQTTADQIASILGKMPAQNARQLEANNNAIAGLGKEGIKQLVTGLRPAGQGENASIEYAIGSFTYASNQPAKEAWRLLAVSAYAEALPLLKDQTNQAFLIYQLQQIARDESVAALVPFLDSKPLSGPTSRALAKIGTPAAAKAMIAALDNPWGDRQLSLIEALGDMRSKEAVPVIERFAKGEELNIRKVAYYALANIGAESSAGIVKSAAAAVNYRYDQANATSSYLAYLKKQIEAGRGALALKHANEVLLVKDLTTSARIAFLEIAAAAQKGDATPVLIKQYTVEAAPEVRAAVLKRAAALLTTGSAAQWVGLFRKGNAVQKAELATWFGNTRSVAAVPALTGLLSGKNSPAKLAAINALGKIGGDASVPALLGVLKTGNPEEIEAVKGALTIAKSAGVVDQVGRILPSLKGQALATAVGVLAARGASGYSKSILGLLAGTDTGVKESAFSALKSVVTVDQLPALFELLSGLRNSGEIAKVQEAITNVISGVGTADMQSNVLSGYLAKTTNKTAVLPLFAKVGGSEALKSVVAVYDGPDESLKTEAVNSLSNWKDDASASDLLRIARQTTNADYRSVAVNGYLKAIASAKKNAVQKVLMIRDIAPYAQSKIQKEAVLRELTKNKTFESLVFAGSYLGQSDVEQAAAQAVVAIGLANKDFNGPEIRQLLTRACSLLTGNNAENQREAVRKHLDASPDRDGFVSLFNGKDLTGWKGLVDNPIKRAAMHPDTLRLKQVKADEKMRSGWSVQNGELVFGGKGDNLCTVKKYGDFEMYVDWKIEAQGDAGIYLRGTPQVQIWDVSRVEVGAEVGSGGLYNNTKKVSKPSSVQDNPIGEWNTFYIKMVGDRVTVDLNGVRVVDNIILENYWDRKIPIFPSEQLELQAHGTKVYYRDVYVKELPQVAPFQLSEEEKKQNFKVLFDGTNLYEWIGNTTDYVVENGDLVIRPAGRGSGNLYTKDEYSDFNFRFEFKLTPGANNGLGIRAPLMGDAAYQGMAELQILDDGADIYKQLQPYQYHGSVYGIIPSKRGYLKPVGEWNQEEVVVQGSRVKVILNGTTIVDGDIREATKDGIPDKKEHPGLFRPSGHIGFLGHGDVVSFRNIRIKDLTIKESGPAAPETGKKKKSKKK